MTYQYSDLTGLSEAEVKKRMHKATTRYERRHPRIAYTRWSNHKVRKTIQPASDLEPVACILAGVVVGVLFWALYTIYAAV